MHIERSENSGLAITDDISLSVQGAGYRIFKRNGIKLQASEEGIDAREHIQWLVAELNGVRAYIAGDHIVLTMEDLYP